MITPSHREFSTWKPPNLSDLAICNFILSIELMTKGDTGEIKDGLDGLTHDRVPEMFRELNSAQL